MFSAASWRSWTKFAWKPIVDGLDKRERNMADQIDQAEAANQKAKDLLAEYEAQADGTAQGAGFAESSTRDGRDAETGRGANWSDKAKEEAKAECQRGTRPDRCRGRRPRSRKLADR